MTLKNIRKQPSKRSFDFVTAHSLDECRFILQIQSDRSDYDGYWPLLPRDPNRPNYGLVVRIEPIDEDTLKFSMGWKDKPYPFKIPLGIRFAESHGFIKRWDRRTCRIIGTTEIPRLVAYPLMTVPLIVFALMINLHGCEVIFALGWLTISLIYLKHHFDLRSQLIDILTANLHPLPESGL